MSLFHFWSLLVLAPVADHLFPLSPVATLLSPVLHEMGSPMAWLGIRPRLTSAILRAQLLIHRGRLSIGKVPLISSSQSQHAPGDDDIGCLCKIYSSLMEQILYQSEA